MRKLYLLLIFCLALSGCATAPDYEQWRMAAVEQQKTAAVAASHCKTDLCVYLVMEKAGQHTIRPPVQQVHPGWELALKTLNTVATLGIPAYFSVENTRALADLTTGVVGTIAGMDRSYSYTDQSTSIGGDQIGRDQDNRDSSIGRDSIGGDQHLGDQYADSCVGDSCLNRSPVDVDQSDHSDQSDRSDNRVTTQLPEESETAAP